jgi:hypothetical protein
MPMTTLSAANRDTVVALIISSLRDLYEQNGIDADSNLSEDTYLIGRRAALDSLGLVSCCLRSTLEDPHRRNVRQCAYSGERTRNVAEA